MSQCLVFGNRLMGIIVLKTWLTWLILRPIVKDRKTAGDSKYWSEQVSHGFERRSWYLYRIMQNMIFRSINFCNRGINRSHESNCCGGMLSFPFGNLSHTSILYYILVYVKLEYNYFRTFMRGFSFNKFSTDKSIIDCIFVRLYITSAHDINKLLFR